MDMLIRPGFWPKCFLYISSVVTSFRSRDEDSLSLQERGIDVQPQDRLPRHARAKVKKNKKKKGRDRETVTEDYDTRSNSSMEVSSTEAMMLRGMGLGAPRVH